LRGLLPQFLRIVQIMKHLWAPWRIEYVAGKRDPGCLFCRAAESPDQRADHVLLKTGLALVMLNRYPYNSGHLMVAPVRHVARISELDAAESQEIFLLAAKMERLLDGVMHPEGYNFGINTGKPGGAGIEDHLHLHVVPRWNGDTNFITVTDDIRVVPQALDALYDDLARALRKMET
jgi:ATP adenylyltransferase